MALKGEDVGKRPGTHLLHAGPLSHLLSEDEVKELQAWS